jgi:hypothetical protein
MDTQMVVNPNQKNHPIKSSAREPKYPNPYIGPQKAHKLRTGENAMKINEDWLSVILAFALMLLAMLGLITPALVAF